MPSVSPAQHRLMEAAAHTKGGYDGVPQSVGKEFVAADAMGEPCAGILLRARHQGPRYLLVQNRNDGQWAQPGGHQEVGETLEECAIRECVEEVGKVPDGPMWPLRNTTSEGVMFACYIKDVEVFDPVISDESLAAGWFLPIDLPENTNPEVRRSIELASGHELDIAKSIRADELLSPQKYENIWLFDLRVTGTGTSFRSSIGEYVNRPVHEFLTDDYVERCNGLPLIFEHPERSILNTEEYRDRAIGTIIQCYIQGDEVRGIAKVFDTDAAQLMLTSHISTSPAVVFRDAGSTETIQLADGKTVLIEGKPSYLDHLAICPAGVWDKGGTPNGVNIQEDSTMAQEDKAPAWADALRKDMSDRLDAACARMDALEKKGGDTAADRARKDAEDLSMADKARKDAEEKEKTEKEEKERADAEKARMDALPEKERKEEEERKDRARKDAEEKEEKEKERADKARKDAEEKKDSQLYADNAKLRADLESVSSRLATLTRPRSSEERDELSRAQVKADSLAQMFGDSVNPPLYDESPIAYRKRLAAKFQKHSASAKDVKLDSLDVHSFAIIEGQIYADAQSVAKSAIALPKGRLHATTDTSTGHRVTEYTGDPEVCWGPFKAPGFIGRINKDVGKRAH